MENPKWYPPIKIRTGKSSEFECSVFRSTLYRISGIKSSKKVKILAHGVLRIISLELNYILNVTRTN